jgi:hypothetical protein
VPLQKDFVKAVKPQRRKLVATISKIHTILWLLSKVILKT